MNFKFKNIDVRGIFTTVPKNILKFKNLSGIYGENEIKKITKVTGINSVRVANKHTTSSDLCQYSASNLMKVLKINPSKIDGLIFVSQTRDYQLPQTSNLLQSKLGLPTSSVCFDLPLGCSGYVNGLLQAALLIGSKSCENILVLAGDTSTKMINDKDRANRMVFGDAGSATLLSKGKNEIGFSIYNDGNGYNDLIIPAGGYREPSSTKTRVNKIAEDGNIRCSEDLFMNGMNIFKFAIEKVPNLINEIVNYSPYLNVECVDGFYMHQANRFMVDYLCKKIKVNKEKMPVEIDGYGNTGPSSIPLLLTLLEKRQKGSANKKNSIFCGFGVGLSWGACYTNLESTQIMNTKDYE